MAPRRGDQARQESLLSSVKGTFEFLYVFYVFSSGCCKVVVKTLENGRG
jgi:hypothetical protein